jgi:hypothetical protein
MRLASVVKTTLVASCVFWSGAACGPGEPFVGREEPFTLRLTPLPDPVQVTTLAPGHGYRELQARWS